jgi:hypothetical protein
MRRRRGSSLAAIAGLATAASTLVIGGPFAGAPPAEAAEPAFSVGLVGDHGSNGTSAALLRHVGSAGLNFFQSLGDLSYDTLSAPAWCQFVKDNVNAGAGSATRRSVRRDISVQHRPRQS